MYYNPVYSVPDVYLSTVGWVYSVLFGPEPQGTGGSVQGDHGGGRTNGQDTEAAY